MAKSLTLQPLPGFNPDVDIGGSLSKRWETWLEDLQIYICASGITDDKQKRDLLLYTAGSRIREIFRTLTETGTDFKTAKDKLTAYFAPHKNTRYEIFKFREMKQEDGEALDSFHRRLRTAAPTCEFHNADFEVEQQIIVGGKSSSIRKKALKDPEYKLKEMLTDRRRKESSTLQAKEIERKSIKEEEIAKVTEKKRTQNTKCWHCGGKFPHFNEKCPVFQSKSNFRGSKRYSKVNKDVKRVQVHENSSSSSSSDEDLCMLKFDAESRKVKPKTNVTIKGQKIKMTVDSGASINVIDEDTFSKLKGIELQKTDVKAYTYGGKQPVRFLGKFTATIETRKSIAAADVYVIKEKNCGCLLSCSTAQELRLISFDLDAIQSFANKSIETIKTDKDLDNILKRYDLLFKGLGKFKRSKVGFNVDPDVEPVVLKHRRVPFHIRTKVSQALKKLMKDDLIEKIPNGQPTPWVSPIVAVPQKDNQSASV